MVPLTPDFLGSYLMEMQTMIQIATMIGVGLTVLVQTVTFVWFMSRLAFRVDAMEANQKAMQLKSEQDNFSVRFAKIEVLLDIIQRQQDEQIVKIDRAATTTQSLYEEVMRLLPTIKNIAPKKET